MTDDVKKLVTEAMSDVDEGKTVAGLGEFALISRLVENLGDSGNEIVRGVGDDAAVFRGPQERLMLATCDAQIEGVHFQFDGRSEEQIGRRAAAVNLSDIAAMGGKPTFALVSLAVPPSMSTGTLDLIYSGLKLEFAKWDVRIIGGNVARLPERLIIDVTLLGEVDQSNLLLRDGAGVGDLVCVTGFLGASAAGLALGSNAELSVAPVEQEAALEAHRVPIPRIAAGRFLGSAGVVTSCMDISDGLVGDAAHIANASGVSIGIDAERLPVAPCVVEIAAALKTSTDSFVLYGGEDYELLFTVVPDSAEQLTKDLYEKTGIGATIIGVVEDGPESVVVRRGGKPVVSGGSGFDHFPDNKKSQFKK
jgi:thiamine-monophosphate kinase